MFVRAVLGAAAILYFTSGTSGAASRLPLQPNGNWIVNFDDAQCIAQRNYGTQEDPLWLVLKQPPLGDFMQFSIIEKRSGNSLATEVNGTVEFDGQTPHKIRVLRYGSVKLKMRTLMMNLPIEHFASARSASALRLRAEGFDAAFALADIEPVLKVMDDCVSDLRQVWNVKGSDEDERAVRDDAKGDLRRLFSSEDYPMQAMRRGDTGSVRMVFLVDETGRVADCSVMETSGVAALDAQSCVVIKERARFTPAIGKDGKPAKGAFIQKITWRLQ
jgi:TonB family protein